MSTVATVSMAHFGVSKLSRDFKNLCTLKYTTEFLAIANIGGYSSAFYHSMPSFAQQTRVCFYQVLQLCLASWSPGT